MKAKLWLIAPALLLAGGFVFRFALSGHDFIGYGLFFAAAVVIAYHFFSPRLRKILTVLLILGVLGFAAVETPILAGAHTDAAEETDYIIVLGAGLHGDEPSLSLTDRLSAALDYTEAHPQAMVIVSGGQGAGENMTEAEAMTLPASCGRIGPRPRSRIWNTPLLSSGSGGTTRRAARWSRRNTTCTGQG